MSVIPKITCRRCGREYSGLRSRCPYCGTGRSKSAERIPLRTSSENAGTPAAEHAAVNTKWQMLFGGILLLAVVAAVIVLITVSLNASQNTPSAAEPTPPATVSSAAPVATPTPTPEPTPTPTPTPSVTSITITFLGSKRTEFAAKVGDEVPLSTTIYPAGGNQTVTWSSKDESIATVSDKGVINLDDAAADKMLADAKCPCLTYSCGKPEATLCATALQLHADGVEFDARYNGETAHVRLPIPGHFSVENALNALGMVLSLGMPLADAAKSMATATGVKGRVEVVPTDTDYTVLIDYAHTPDGLKNILSTVCGFADARVLVVFGCGGDRDRTKRAEMGRIAARLADEVIVTSDNPRTENPYAILHEILAGMADSATPFAVLESRREAITYALDHARTGDVVVLAGKGHETYQVVGAETLPLDERQVVREHLSQ